MDLIRISQGLSRFCLVVGFYFGLQEFKKLEDN